MKRLLIILLLAGLIVPFCHAVDVTLTWDHNDPLPDGYRIFHRESGQYYDYDSPAWEGTENTCTLVGLSDDIDHWFVCRAFVAADESADSNEVVWIAAVFDPLFTDGFSLTWTEITVDPPPAIQTWDITPLPDGSLLYIRRQ